MENGRDARNSSKEIDILIINNSSPTNHFTSDNNFHNNPLTDSNSKELEHSNNKNINLLNQLIINEEKIIGPGYVLVKSDSQALIVSTPSINTDGLNVEQLLETLKNERDNDSIYINMAELEQKYLTNNLYTNEDEKIESYDKKAMDKLYTEVIERHPFKVVEGKSRKYPFCTNTGWFCGCGKCGKSKLDTLGIGMVVYFKFLKALLVSFLLIAILNSFLVISYISNHHDKPAKSYLDSLFRTTIGNIGSTLYNCIKIPIEELNNQHYYIKFNCNGMTVGNAVSFGLPEQQKDYHNNLESCFSFLSFENIIVSEKCNLLEFINEKMTLCSPGTSCSLFIDMSLADCFYNTQSGFKYLFLSYSCFKENVSTGFGGKKMSRSDFSIVVVSIDLASMVIVIITFLLIKKCSGINYQKFIEENTFIRDFTLHLTDLNIPKQNIKQEFNDLMTHFYQVAKVEDPSLSIFNFEDICIKKQSCFGDYIQHVQNNFNPNKYFIYDMIYPILNGDKLSGIKKFNKLKKKYRELIEKNTKKEHQKNDEQNTKEVVYECLEQKNNEKIQKIRDEMETIKKRINTKDDVKEINEMYITFRNYKIAKFYEELYKKSSCERCHAFCCCKGKTIRHLYYKGKWLNLKFTKDEPTNIKWENITYNPCKRRWRRCFSLCFGFIIMLITLLLIIIGKHYQNELTSEYNTSINCNYISGWRDENKVIKEFNDPSLSVKQKVLTYCFCNEKIGINSLVTGNIRNFSINGNKPCREIVDTYLEYVSMTIGIILIIPLINSIVIAILKLLTRYEKNKTLSDDMSTNMWKIFIIQFANTGLLLVLVNMKIENIHEKIPNFPFFAGNYDDMDPSWYASVGVMILISMMVNIVTPHIASLLLMSFNYCCRCCDSGCTCGLRTKKQKKKDYYSLYTGSRFDMDSRYATILSTFYIVLIFAPGMPLLYICFFLFIVLTYTIDKYLITQFYRMPPKYDLHILDMFLDFTLVGIILHFCFAIWVYGNPYLLVDYSFTDAQINHSPNYLKSLLIKNKSFWAVVFERFTLIHNLPLVLAVLLIIIAKLIYTFLFHPLKALFCPEKDLSLNKTSNIEIGLAVPLRQLFRTYQIKKIEYFQNVKSQLQNNEELLDNLRYGINYAKNFMVYKISKVYEGEVSELKSNFDTIIEESPDLIELERKSIIKGDPSYNIAFIPEFESFAYYEYLKNM